MLNFEPFQLPDPSGKMSKESYVLKNHNLEYHHIMEWCQSKGFIDIAFKEKVYLFLNDLRSIPKCKNPDCVNLTTFKNSTLGYKDYCSLRCISSDPEVKKKKEEKSLLKFGTKTPSQSNEIKDKIIKTNQQKWGGNSPMSSLDVRQKSNGSEFDHYPYLDTMCFLYTDEDFLSNVDMDRDDMRVLRSTEGNWFHSY